jgi:isopentenyl phosphate kinase
MSNTQSSRIIFLKLGGSLITEKSKPRTARMDVINRLADELRLVISENRDLKIVLGHGSGSFAHVPAKKFGTRKGVHSERDWKGFSEVWYEAALLNRMVIDTLHSVGLPGITFPVSSGAIAKDGQVASWNLEPLMAALDYGLLPVVYGDVVFDQGRGGTIFSTEDIFVHLAEHLNPGKILLAGNDEGVFADYPNCLNLIPKITPHIWVGIAPALVGSAATDVTGGMLSKVKGMLGLVKQYPTLEIQIFGGNQPGNLSAVLRGKLMGTRIFNDN